MSNACPLDGSIRTVLDRDADSVTWRCPWCHTVAREVHDLIRDGLQKEWE